MNLLDENYKLDFNVPASSEEIIDLNAKRIFNRKYMSKSQLYYLFKEHSMKYRDDLSDYDLIRNEKKLDLAEALTLVFKKYYNNEISKFNILFPNQKDILHALITEREKFNIDHTSALKWDSFLKWDERIRMINWVNKIENKVNKYEMLYPLYDETHHFNIKESEKLKILSDRQNKVKNTICKEMGIDFTIFD